MAHTTQILDFAINKNTRISIPRTHLLLPVLPQPLVLCRTRHNQQQQQQQQQWSTHIPAARNRAITASAPPPVVVSPYIPGMVCAKPELLALVAATGNTPHTAFVGFPHVNMTSNTIQTQTLYRTTGIIT